MRVDFTVISSYECDPGMYSIGGKGRFAIAIALPFPLSLTALRLA